MNLDEINSRIDDTFETYPKQLRVAARYVRENPEKIAMHSLRQVSDLANVHPSSLMRLVRELGFERYNEFRDPFRSWLGGEGSTMRGRVEGLRTKGKLGQMSEAVAEVFARDMSDLQSTASQIGIEDLVAAADAFIAARRVFIVGFRSLYSAAFFLDYNCRMFSDKTVLIDGRGGVLGDEVRDAGPDDVVVVLSHRSYSSDALKIARYAESAGARIVSIVDSSLAPTIAISDVKLVLAASQSSVLSSVVSTLAVVQALITVIVSRIGDDVFDRMKRNEAFYKAFDTFVED
ncbi:MurR/RpiR family transcriptional regulator [Mesorhizobium sp. B2-3-4]|uniref:MurR/RpiR family transcriptional regulator n=1 Tax=Mesorhizobium sp. B2-3-4 TaxID=2589959 RepID=UPI0011282598|nr:MurR/RpiR family transcriptional regulator [Mesorhizobium sp. B2-3-4]TPM40540.1 MurR/RpiR family transcriptional regulator [Mesorhizobium sp. B2-3-4]